MTQTGPWGWGEQHLQVHAGGLPPSACSPSGSALTVAATVFATTTAPASWAPKCRSGQAVQDNRAPSANCPQRRPVAAPQHPKRLTGLGTPATRSPDLLWQMCLPRAPHTHHPATWDHSPPHTHPTPACFTLTCTHTFTCTHTHMHPHIRAHTLMFTCTHTHTHPRVHAHTLVSTCTHTHAHSRACTHSCPRAPSHACTHTRVRVHTHSYAHSRAHTHICTHSLSLSWAVLFWGWPCAGQGPCSPCPPHQTLAAARALLLGPCPSPASEELVIHNNWASVGQKAEHWGDRYHY